MFLRVDSEQCLAINAGVIILLRGEQLVEDAAKGLNFIDLAFILNNLILFFFAPVLGALLLLSLSYCDCGVTILL